MTRRELLFGGASLAVLSVAPARAGSVAGFGGATEITQLLNHAQLIASYAKQAQSVVEQVRQVALTLQQYQNMVQNTLRVPFQIWSDVQTQLADLSSVVREGQSLAVSLAGLDASFLQRFPGYAQHVARAAGGILERPGDLQRQFAGWYDTTADTIRGALKAAGLQEQQFASEEATMRQLRTMSMSSAGQMQALQVGNQIAGEMVGQMQKLRALSAAQAQATLTFYAAQNDEAAAKRAATEEFLREREPTIIGDGARYQWR